MVLGTMLLSGGSTAYGYSPYPIPKFGGIEGQAAFICATPSDEKEAYTTGTEDAIGTRSAQRAATACGLARGFACQPRKLQTEAGSPVTTSLTRCWWHTFAGTTIPAMRTIAVTLPERLVDASAHKGNVLFQPSGLLLIAIFGFGATLAVRWTVGMFGDSEWADRAGQLPMRAAQLVVVLIGVGVVVTQAEFLWNLAGAAIGIGANGGRYIAAEFTERAMGFNDTMLPIAFHPPTAHGGAPAGCPDPWWVRTSAGCEKRLWLDAVSAFGDYSLRVATVAGQMVGTSLTMLPSGGLADVAGTAAGSVTGGIDRVVSAPWRLITTMIQVAGATALAMGALMLTVSFVLSVAEAIMYIAIPLALSPIFIMGHLAPSWVPSTPNLVRMVIHGTLILLATGLCVALAAYLMDVGFQSFARLIMNPDFEQWNEEKMTQAEWQQWRQGCKFWADMVLAQNADPRDGFRGMIGLMTCGSPTEQSTAAIDVKVAEAGWLPGLLILLTLSFTATAVIKFATVIATELSNAGIQGGQAAEKGAEAARSGLGAVKGVAQKGMNKLIAKI